MYSMWLTADEQALWRDYLAMTARLQAALNQQLQRDCGLSLADYDVLVALAEHRQCRMNELGGHLGWEQSRVSHQVRRMGSRGLVHRQDADADRRGATVELTTAGREALAGAAPGHAELVRAVVFDGMTGPQIRVVGQWLSGVLSRLGASSSIR